MKSMKSLAALLFFLFAVTGVFAQKKVKDKFLNKKTYTVEVTLIGGKKTKVFSDEISFASGKIKSKYLSSPDNGYFLQGDYEVSDVDSTGEAWTCKFKGSCKNEKEDYLIIEGTIYGDMIDGTMLWETKKKKKKSDMTFTGSKKVKGAKATTTEKVVETKTESKSSKTNDTKEAETKTEEKKPSGKKTKEELLDEEILKDEE